jgi:SOS regulatory protein LexA
MPSYSEICVLCKISSKNTAHNLVKKLCATGKIKTDSRGKIIPNKDSISEALSIPISPKRTSLQDKQSGSSSSFLPSRSQTHLTLLGLVEAGFPTPSEESLHENISLDDWVIEKKEASFMLKVRGDSMRDAGILDGDMVIVERTQSAKTGEIIVAEVDGAYTMKYLRKDKSGNFYLDPANDAFKPIYPKENLQITAVVKAVVRKY